ncbi:MULTISPECIES: spore coat protein CotJB [Bacillaceae]|uniref:Spore coat peptide assembly protein n=1 Tax=Cytobacillus firmus DS1 TaxID=1307436 RepID=W7LFM7_CYTFI|nr:MULTISPECIES: spore coat protein CotJB [Bacillaceae]EWG10809.1 spore coat peptide assembly protein [Cytobacillus firmus DS1]MBN8200316.1 spore coat protein CotJB [Bacillus sp. NTK034]
MKQLPADYYQLLEQLQAVDFVLVDLTLYLDTHNNDTEAIKQFNHYAKERKKLRNAIESKYGPLMQFGHSYSGQPWNWDDAPWPWQV